MNAIENLWAIVKRKIHDRKPTTLDQLKQNIATAWEAVSAETCDKLVKIDAAETSGSHTSQGGSHKILRK